MDAGALSLGVADQTLDFEPPAGDCAACGRPDGVGLDVEMTPTGSETVAVAVTFVCAACGTDRQTETQTVPLAAFTDDGDGEEETSEMIAWIEQYYEEEGRYPSKSKTVQSCPYEILEAQDVLEDLVDAGRLEESEELRATNRITVYKPT